MHACLKLTCVLQSFDLQRVLEGEKALRSEAARQLKEVEKKLVSVRSPAVSLSSPMVAPPGSLSSLEREQDQLQQQIRAHSAQVSLTHPHLLFWAQTSWKQFCCLLYSHFLLQHQIQSQIIFNLYHRCSKRATATLRRHSYQDYH